MILTPYFTHNYLDTAVHEAGHAVVAHYSGATVIRVTARGEGHQDGLMNYEYQGLSRFHLDAIAAAGFAACEMYDRNYDMVSDRRSRQHWDGAASDFATIPDPLAASLRATTLLEANWFRVEALAAALLESPTYTLSGAEVDAVLRTQRPQSRSVSVPDFVPADWSYDSAPQGTVQVQVEVPVKDQCWLEGCHDAKLTDKGAILCSTHHHAPNAFQLRRTAQAAAAKRYQDARAARKAAKRAR